MTFEVRPNRKKRHRMLLVQILCGVMTAAMLWFLNWELMAEQWQKEPWTYWLFVGFIGVFLLLFLFSLYGSRRPLIRVEGQIVTFYPLFGPAKRITWQEITSRKAEADRSYRTMGAVAASMAGGIIGYTLYQKARGIDPDTPLSDYPRKYTYYQGDRKLISILGREMENADRFDQMAAGSLESGSLGTAEGLQAAAAESAPAGKRNLPPVLAVGIGAVCILAVAGAAALPWIRSAAVREPAGQGAMIPYTCQDVTFEIAPAWTAIEGWDGSFLDGTGMVIYQLNGVSQLYPYTPEEFYSALLDFYEQEHDPVIGGPLEADTGADGTVRYMADIKMVQEDTYYLYFTLVMFPEQDTAVTFGAQATADGAALYEEEILRTVENMALSASYAGQSKQVLSFDLEETYFTGTSWIDRDGAQLVFHEDLTFHFYQDKDHTDDNYIFGTYEFRVGESAGDYLSGYLADYGITEEERDQIIHAHPEYSLDQLVCLTTVNRSAVIDGQERLSEATETYYLGFLTDDGAYLDLLSMNTASQYGFTKE